MRTLSLVAAAILLTLGLANAEPRSDQGEDAAEEATVRALVAQEAAALAQAQADLTQAQQLEAQILSALDE